MEDHSGIEEVDCYDPSTHRFAHVKGAPEKELLAEFNRGTIISGESTLMLDGAYFDEENGSLVIGDLNNAQYGVLVVPEARRRKLATVVGVKEMLAVRIVAPDASTTSSESEIGDSWFGTNGDVVNFKSQYEACSYGKLTINAFNNAQVSNGATTVSIADNVSGADSGVIVDAAVDALGSLRNEADHVMLCIPSGTSGSWIAYAYINHWLSVYNNQWCNYVSAQMHGE